MRRLVPLFGVTQPWMQCGDAAPDVAMVGLALGEGDADVGEGEALGVGVGGRLEGEEVLLLPPKLHAAVMNAVRTIPMTALRRSGGRHTRRSTSES